MIDIEELALLARIKLTPKFKERLSKGFKEILDYFEKLKSADVSDIKEGPINITDTINIFREDELLNQPGDYSEDILNQAPATEEGYIKVKHILN